MRRRAEEQVEENERVLQQALATEELVNEQELENKGLTAAMKAARDRAQVRHHHYLTHSRYVHHFSICRVCMLCILGSEHK